jgi:undecaprenyl-diphosphatase
MWLLIDNLDATLMTWLRVVDAPWVDAAMRWISASGGAGLVWLVLGVIALCRPHDRAAAWRVLLTLMLAYLVVDGALKPLFQRPRPDPAVYAFSPKREMPPLPRSWSFPSGHAASTFGAAVVVSRMWPQTRVIWWMLAVLIGYSRIYLGHHHPLAVLGGALLGVAVAFWVLGGRHRATYASTLSLPPGVIVKP